MFDISALYEAKSVENALFLLTEHPNAKIIAGGTDVLIQVREGRLAGAELVSLQKLDALRGVSCDADGSLRIGSLTTFSSLAANRLVRERIPVLAEAVTLVGGPQIRNVGTIGGNVCNGVTSADSASTLMAFDALLEYTSASAVRLVPIQEHYVGAGKTALRHEELLTAIIIRRECYRDTFGHYIKYAMREAMDIATVGCSVNLRLNEDKTAVDKAHAAFGVTGPVPMRAAAAEEFAAGKSVTEENLEESAKGFGKAAASCINARTSWRATREFRTHLAEELAKRAFVECVRRAQSADTGRKGDGND